MFGTKETQMREMVIRITEDDKGKVSFNVEGDAFSTVEKIGLIEEQKMILLQAIKFSPVKPARIKRTAKK